MLGQVRDWVRVRRQSLRGQELFDGRCRAGRRREHRHLSAFPTIPKGKVSYDPPDLMATPLLDSRRNSPQWSFRFVPPSMAERPEP